MNNDEIKSKIIKLYNEGKTDEEIANEVMIIECSVDVFGGKYPRYCNEDYCEECSIRAVENF